MERVYSLSQLARQAVNGRSFAYSWTLIREKCAILDLVIGLVAMLLLSATLFVVGRRIAFRGECALVLMVGAATLLHLALFLQLLWDNLLLARLLPWSNLIVVGNAQPALVGLLAGLASGLATIPVWRRALLVSTITTISLWKSYAPLGTACPRLMGITGRTPFACKAPNQRAAPRLPPRSSRHTAS